MGKDLGVYVDRTIKFSEHCNSVANSANATLGMIRCTITCKNKDIILRLYKALVRPDLDYWIQACTSYFKKDIVKLEKVQLRATKMIWEFRNLTYAVVCSAANMLQNYFPACMCVCLLLFVCACNVYIWCLCIVAGF